MHNKIPQSPEELLSSTGKGSDFIASLEDLDQWTSIPLLNYTPLHDVKDLSIVRFRGMIQDMHDPEIYLERYEVKRGDGAGSCRLQEGKYRDCLVLEPNEEVDYNSPSNVQGERRTLFVVSIPGQNNWCFDYEQECNRKNLPQMSNCEEESSCGGEKVTSAKKRPAPTDDKEMMDLDMNSPETAQPNLEKTSDAHKKQCTAKSAAGPSPMIGQDYHLNSPIPERPGKACMVKIYNEFDAYSLNSIIDVVGFLSVDPALDISSMDVDTCGGLENLTELQALNPPPSLIPRIHALVVHRLPHPNPLLDARLLKGATTPIEPLNMISVQKELRTLLSLCLFNDSLAADYMLSHLISTVYSRSEMQSIGKFALNIFNLPKETTSDYTKKLYEILELLIPASHYLPMTLETMNTASFVPKKDYESNKLVSGLLQLAPHTHLVLDETYLQQGKLEANGVRSIQNLAHLINQQQIKCNFHFYDIDYNSDVPVLVLSEGRSLLPHDFAVPLQTDNDSVQLMEETFKAAHHFLQPTRLDQFRRFLTLAKTRPFTMNVEESEMIQTDFVEMRKSNTIKSADDLHQLLVLSRLLAIARGKAALDKESWQVAKEMEMQRKQRVDALPKSNKPVQKLF